MEEILQKFQDLKIQLEDLKSATNNFDDQNRIGAGGFGGVFKGEVSHSKGRSMVAIKRLDRKRGQGDSEFLKEIYTLSRYKHDNLISLLGFCYQGDGEEAILVYELASRGSLDRHLNSLDLTWSKRIKICLDAAKGLRYLHDSRGTHQRLIHCDVKGGNILLDDDWNAKVADFGFSMMGPANELQSTIINLAAGTPGYIDPLYWRTNTLSKESDVYSFGVVLFEVLCGRVCYALDSDGRVQSLVPAWKECYEQKKLNDIIFKNPSILPLDQFSLKTYSDIVYRCLKESREDRPTMAEVVTELETALGSQESFEIQEREYQEFIGEWSKQHSYYEKIAKSAEPPLYYKSEDELQKLLCEGVLLNKGKTHFSLTKKGEHCEMISIGDCLGSEFKSRSWVKYNSRFPDGTYRSRDGIFKTRVRTQFLSPGITYTVNLVFKFVTTKEVRKCCDYISLKHKLHGETKRSISYMAYERDDGWWAAELYQFTSDHRIVDLEIMFDGFGLSGTIEVEGIEFRPLEKVEHTDENQHISDSDSDANWEEKMPTDYENFKKWSNDTIRWTTKKEAYSMIRKGFLMNKNVWFYLDKNGKQCHMLSAEAAVWFNYYTRESMSLESCSKSRFGKAFLLDNSYIRVIGPMQLKLLSSKTTYAVYLVYKLPKYQSKFQAPVKVEMWNESIEQTRYIYLVSPQIPVVRPKAQEDTHNPLCRPKLIGLPQLRNDDWMEVQIWEFQNALPVDLKLTLCDGKMFSGIIIEGIEFRPI